MTKSPEGQSPSPSDSPTLLCVDKEPATLASLQRLFESSNYRVAVADSGAAALQHLEANPVDILIADMRLSDMEGTELLARVRERWPATERFLLTVKADVSLLIDAINQGLISRFITKPLEEDTLLRIVGDALAGQARQRLVAEMAKRRNEELRALNSSLEQNVNANSEELAAANARLKENLIVTLKVFSSLIETRHERLAGHARRVADLARRLAIKLKLEPALVREIFFAALLHEIGKLGFSDQLLNTPVGVMTPQQAREYRQHPQRAEQLLMPLQDLRGAAGAIAAQLERFDGTGYPNQLKGREILVGARILSVCTDYDNLQIGMLAPRESTPKEALAVIVAARGKRYDPWIVDAFAELVADVAENLTVADPAAPHEIVLSAGGLAEGMLLARDLVAPNGVMMLSAGFPLDSRLISKIAAFERSIGEKLTIYIRKDEPAPA
ncbi:HD domain-containing phosphohydrolase [Piscinibacter sakaiensis]|uniref:HD domain-containing phosphohydrolase n=1 Tax=Piscinibacter sakaiensis TaxID=1547922 RepID=UPI003AAB0864